MISNIEDMIPTPKMIKSKFCLSSYLSKTFLTIIKIINAIVKALESIIPKIPEAIELTAAITQIIAFVSTL